MANKKVIVALSGGVDSAVSAALLKKQGFDVFGVFFRFFKNPPKSPLNKGGVKKKFEQNQALNKAKKVAKALNIPFKIIDARREFKKKVIDYFVDSYEKGITPNPCVVCNKEMKFRLLFDLLKRHKADYISTGHYARIARQSSAFPFLEQSSRNSSKPSFNYKLLEAADKSKDQSYFLYRLSQKELAKTIFPLGELKKTEVRKIAKKIKLPIFGDEESQDICFLADSDINRFLRKYIKPKLGNIVDEKGNMLARHKGLPFYTIGQRKGIEIGGIGPYFVIGKNSRKNELVVSDDSRRLLTKKFEVNLVNWVHPHTKKNERKVFGVGVKIQIRYHAPKISAIIKLSKLGKWIIETKRPLRAVTPGQSAVFYKNSEVLGGGIIA